MPEELSQDPGLGASPELATLIVVGAIGVVIAVLIVFWVISRFLVICMPNEVLVISGRSHRLQDGSTVGYKVLHGGRGLRMPVLEEVNRMDMRLFPVQVEVHNAYSKGGIPLTRPRHREREGREQRSRLVAERGRALPRPPRRARSALSRSRRSKACCARSSRSSRPRR